MSIRHPLEIGAALAITVAIGYGLCTLVFWLLPDAAANFMNALFHGLDFAPLKRDGTFTFASFAYGLAVLAAWAFFMGAIFAWVEERIRGLGEPRVAGKAGLAR